MIVLLQMLSLVSFASENVELTESVFPKVEIGFQYGGGYLIGSENPYVSSKAPGFFFIGLRKGRWSLRSSLPGFLLDDPHQSGSVSFVGRFFTLPNGFEFTSSIGIDAGYRTRWKKHERPYTPARLNAYVGFERDIAGNFFNGLELGVGVQGHELHPTESIMVSPLINCVWGYKF